MKKFLLSALCAAVLIPAAAQTAYLECDFSQGIPKDFTLSDEDGLEPSIDMKEVGFAVGTPWLALKEADGHTAAVSTSWYRKAGTSDDWMITPQITIASSQAVLRWNAKAGDADYRDGYSVYVSDSAITPDDFKKLEPVYSVKQEKAQWTEHEVSLSYFSGKKVRVAFVNNTRDRATLWIDDLFVGIPSALRIESGINRIVNEAGPIELLATVTNVSESEVRSFTISYRFGDGETYTKEYNHSVRPGATSEIGFFTECDILRNETLPYELTVTVGKDSSSVSGLITCFNRRIVAEEVTGVWCGYCVRGIVAMKQMKELYPDSFIGIAVHGSSPTWEDPMDYTDYTDYLFSSLGMTGYPHATVNRRKAQTGDPAAIPTYFNQLLERELNAGLQLTVEPDEKGGAKLHTDVYFLNDMEGIDYRLAYVMIENDVKGETVYDEDGNPKQYNGYEQYNYYANNAMGEMGGFESLPQVVPGTEMVYQDVARAFWGDGFEGFSGSLPGEVKAATAYGHDLEIEIPENILDEKNAEMVALLINHKTGEILNADLVPLYPTSLGITEAVDGEGIALRFEGTALSLRSDSPLSSVILCDLEGRTVTLANPGEGEYTFDLSGLKGIYVLRAVAGETVLTKKLSL